MADHKLDSARHLVLKFRGPLATVYACPFCRHQEIFRSGGRRAEWWALENGRSNGRGYGLAMGGALHSKLAAHIRKDHPEKILEVSA
jgi:hypothetical protein